MMNNVFPIYTFQSLMYIRCSVSIFFLNSSSFLFLYSLHAHLKYKGYICLLFRFKMTPISPNFRPACSSFLLFFFILSLSPVLFFVHIVEEICIQSVARIEKKRIVVIMVSEGVGQIKETSERIFNPVREVDVSREMSNRYMNDLISFADSDVAIIGAGPSGLACAYELGKKCPDAKIAIYEASVAPGGGSWIGGQLFSGMVVRKPAVSVWMWAFLVFGLLYILCFVFGFQCC